MWRRLLLGTLLLAALARSHVPRPTRSPVVSRVAHGWTRAYVALSDNVPVTPASPAPPSSPPVEPKSYEEAEKLGLAQFAAGDFNGAIKRFEQAKKLPGAGYDVVRVSPGSQIPGDKSQPPNPRGLQESRFASPAQLAIADYNIACAKLKLGAKEEALERLRAFVLSVENPDRQFERMLADVDLAELAPELRALQAELKAARRFDPFGAFKKLLDQPFVEWK